MPTAIRDPIHWPRECVSRWRDSSRWPSPPASHRSFWPSHSSAGDRRSSTPNRRAWPSSHRAGAKGWHSRSSRSAATPEGAFGPLLAALVVIPYGQTSIVVRPGRTAGHRHPPPHRQLVQTTTDRRDRRTGNRNNRSSRIAPPQDPPCAADPHDAGLLEILLHRLHDQLLHILPYG